MNRQKFLHADTLFNQEFEKIDSVEKERVHHDGIESLWREILITGEDLGSSYIYSVPGQGQLQLKLNFSFYLEQKVSEIRIEIIPSYKCYLFNRTKIISFQQGLENHLIHIISVFCFRKSVNCQQVFKLCTV